MYGDLTEFLACPRGRSFPLELSGAPNNGKQILAGELRCPAHGHVFYIEAGIPRFVEKQSLGELQRHEMEMRDQAHRSRTFRMAVSDLPEYDAVRSALGDCRGLRALDAGCGSGKMSHTLGSPALLVGVDFSFAALLKFHFPGDSRVDLVQSEGSQMPFREACFDVALSTQVLEHVPSKDLRVGFLRQIGRALKPGGKLVLTVYNWNLYSQHSRGSRFPRERDLLPHISGGRTPFRVGRDV